MSDAFIPPYPPSLTVKFWDKAKGLSSVKTGVTELLQACESQFKKAPWEVTSVSQLAAIKLRGPEALANFKSEYHRTNQPIFRKLQSDFANLSIDLAKKGKEFGVDPKRSKYAPILQKMSVDADKFTYAVAWGTVSDRVQKDILEIEKSFEERAKKSRGYINQIDSATEKVIKKLQEYKKPPTPKEYQALFSQYHRLPGTFIGVASKDIPELRLLFKEFLEYASKHWTTEPPQNTDMDKMVKTDIKMLKQAKEIASKL